MSKKKKLVNFEMVVAGFIALLLLAMVAVMPFAYIASEQYYVATIKSKERVYHGEASYYLVFTDSGVFKIQDSFLYFAFDSSDRYNSLDVGETESFTAIGWRVGFLSMYPTIVSVED